MVIGIICWEMPVDYAVTIVGDGRPIGTEYSALNLEQLGCAAVKRESAQDPQRGPPAAKAESGPGRELFSLCRRAPVVSVSSCRWAGEGAPGRLLL